VARPRSAEAVAAVPTSTPAAMSRERAVKTREHCDQQLLKQRELAADVSVAAAVLQ